MKCPSKGFRAPQLFDEDLHIDNAGGDLILGLAGRQASLLAPARLRVLPEFASRRHLFMIYL